MAAVDKIEEMRKPEDFIGYRNRRWQNEVLSEGEIQRSILSPSFALLSSPPRQRGPGRKRERGCGVVVTTPYNDLSGVGTGVLDGPLLWDDVGIVPYENGKTSGAVLRLPPI